jgi:hypothetical protein
MIISVPRNENHKPGRYLKTAIIIKLINLGSSIVCYEAKL